MKCHLVLDEYGRGWIIEKTCRRLEDALRALGCDVSIGEAENPAATINHFMLFLKTPPQGLPLSTVAITHIDDTERLKLARAAVETTDLAVCMSTMTVRQLVNSGLERNKLCYVLPALDPGLVPRRIVVGITTRVYSDGRKREQLLARLAREIDLSIFHFEIFGDGWEQLGVVLRQAGAMVSIYGGTGNPEEDYRQIRERVPFFDYYLYLGLDEGSLGTLDALAAGVKTMVTPQGFHVDLPQGITHPFWKYTDLKAIFESIGRERDCRVRAVRNLTWREYAERHLYIWRALLEGQRQELPRLLGQESLEPLGGYSENIDQHLASERRLLFFRSLRRSYIPRLRTRIGKIVPDPVRKYLFHR